MKILTAADVQGHSEATTRGAVEGAASGAALALPTFYLLNRRWPYYRSLPLSLKVLGGIFLVVPGMAIQAERRGLQFERAQWSGVGKAELDREALETKEAWEKLSSESKVQNWLVNHQYSIMAGSWVASCAVAGSIIWRNPYQTAPQKIVQVRMWAQGLTIGIILAAGLLTHRNRQDAVIKRPADHSWAAMLEEQQREEEARKVKPMSAA